MLKRSMMVSVLLSLLLSLPSFASADPTVEYRILLDGQDLAVATPGNFADTANILMEVQVRVTNNTWNVPGLGDTDFGLQMGGFHLIEDDQVPGVGGIPGHLQFDPNPPFENHLWNSTTVSPLANFKGYLDIYDGYGSGEYGDVDVYEQAVFLNPGDWASHYNTFGAGVFDTVVSGEFSWDGSATDLTLATRAIGVLYWDADTSQVRTMEAFDKIGDGVQFVPEPATLALLGLGGLGVLLRRRRRQA